MDIQKLLVMMVEKSASDLFITAGKPPCVKLDGKMTPVTSQPLSPEQAMEVVLSVMNDTQREEFERTRECNFAILLEEQVVLG